MKFIRIKGTLLNSEMVQSVEVVSIYTTTTDPTPIDSSHSLKFWLPGSEWHQIPCDSEDEAEAFMAEFQKYANETYSDTLKLKVRKRKAEAAREAIAIQKGFGEYT